jgi:hypothetical protein
MFRFAGKGRVDVSLREIDASRAGHEVVAAGEQLDF